MKQFITKHEDLISGVLSGFDRLVFRGSVRTIAHLAGMHLYLSRVGVLLKDFMGHVQGMTARIRKETAAAALAAGLNIRYLDSPKTDKEAIARQIAAERKITEGPICILSALERCRGYDIYRNPEKKQLELTLRWRKCLFYYHYMIHPVFGFMNARIQTWAPFPIQICINGREWLCRQLDQERIRYIRRENCIVWVEDPTGAQQLLDEQLRVSWPKLLDDVATLLNPVHKDMFKAFPMSYYWCTYQSEWATDVMFYDAEDLARLYSRFVLHGITTFGSCDVMRFLGKKTTNQGRVQPAFKGQVISSYKRRPEGVRVKHSVNDNSIKLYDKQGSVLRAETTINNSRDLKVFRHKEGQKSGPKSWQRMRKGTADLHRRAQLSQAANERYLDALAAVCTDLTLEELTKDICRPVTYQGKRIRALHPWEPKDIELFKAVTRGEFLITGFRNRDIARLLFPKDSASAKERKRISAIVSYRLRILRAHRLIVKIPKTHRYLLTPNNRALITALLSAHHATIAQLTKEVA
jgi:hypothetical protein